MFEDFIFGSQRRNLALDTPCIRLHDLSRRPCPEIVSVGVHMAAVMYQSMSLSLSQRCEDQSHIVIISIPRKILTRALSTK